jgi:hypothetical protein
VGVRRRPAEDGGVGAPPPAGRAEAPASTWTSSLSGFCARACFPRIAPSTWANGVPLETVRNARRRWRVDQTWTRQGPPGSAARLHSGMSWVRSWRATSSNSGWGDR